MGFVIMRLFCESKLDENFDKELVCDGRVDEWMPSQGNVVRAGMQ